MKRGLAAAGAVVAVPVVAAGIEIAKQPPCEFSSSCRNAVHALGYHALDGDPIQSSFTTYSSESEIRLFNTTKTTISKTAVLRLFQYYEQAFGDSKRTNLPIILPGRTRPTDIRVSAQPRSVSEHIIIVANADRSMPGNVANDGVTSLIKPAPNGETVSIIKSDAGQGVTATDVLATEACQAVVRVDTEDTPLITDLGQETLCNSMGDAAIAATHNMTYDTYRQYIHQLNQLSSIVPYHGHEYEIEDKVIDRNTYVSMQQDLTV